MKKNKHIDMKRTYIPCQLEMIEFNVERGFAASGDTETVVGAFANAVNTQEWNMGCTKQKDFRNDDAKFNSIEVGGWFE